MRFLFYFNYKHVTGCLTWLAVLHNARPGEHRECVFCSGSISECFKHTHLSLFFFFVAQTRAHTHFHSKTFTNAYLTPKVA
jgi:hypothetical protein